MHSSQRTPKCPSQRGQGEGWGPGCRDGGGVGGEVSQVTGRNRPRTSPEDLPLSSRGLRREGQLEAECAHRAWPSAERMQTQASWCGPEAVLPITCFPGLLQEEGGGEKGEKERKIRACVRKILHPSSQIWLDCDPDYSSDSHNAWCFKLYRRPGSSKAFAGPPAQLLIMHSVFPHAKIA